MILSSDIGGEREGAQAARIAAESGGLVNERPRLSFIADIAARLVAVSCLGTIAIAGTAFFYLDKQIERSTLENLSDYVAERGRSESELFERADRYLTLFKQQYLELYSNPETLSKLDFDKYYMRTGNQSWRLKPRYYNGWQDTNGLTHSGTSAFVGSEAMPLDGDIKRRLVLGYMLVDRYGPAWVGEFANLHASLPEGALIIHWPGVPWGLDADANLTMSEGTVVGSTLKRFNPERKNVWTSLYFDKTAQAWTVTYMMPVDAPDGQHLITPSFDIELNDLVRRVTTTHPYGGYSMILSRQGNVVAHPAHLADALSEAGQLSIDELGDPVVKHVYDRLFEADIPQTGSARVISAPEIGAYIGATQLAGPDWWLITVYPESIVTKNVRDAANMLFMLILALSALLIISVMVVLRRSIARPLKALKDASERIASGDYKSIARGELALPEDRKDEIGLLSRSFRGMAEKIGEANRDLEQAVIDRTIELELANQKLRDLSLKDSLTGALNRRAFDRDLDEALRRSDDVVLTLFDIDYFKLFNDTYGHAAGDEALRRVTTILRAALPLGRVYRYGGEEIAVLQVSSDPKEALHAAAQAAKTVANIAMPHEASEFGVITISGGSALLKTYSESAEMALNAADRALYRAKNAGRNRVFSAELTTAS
ncbi:diguanylate cyclase [Altericroceibacterium endophyticum]|uniref:diguanylate cyclase n=1 Tax=Altericroceibacterium endophyticum TaxID=1808508 RepID=A0A6I4T5H4_9SPHN|nr:diguanylate cyclase [Altericroceibacterium endophyticum]MXO66126.1 diguanylate cyclase [Altericroceibacterium endophyticum]